MTLKKEFSHVGYMGEPSFGPLAVQHLNNQLCINTFDLDDLVFEYRSGYLRDGTVQTPVHYRNMAITVWPINKFQIYPG